MLNIDRWIESNKQKFGSDYEIMFARNVLPKVHGLDLKNITLQYPFRDKDGKQRYCDFVFIESDTVRFVIEIDGYDKRGTGTGMSRDDFIDWQRRQASLVSQGWYVLRFANNDVRDFPDDCAGHINALLKRLRSEASKLEFISPTLTNEIIKPPEPEPEPEPERIQTVMVMQNQYKPPPELVPPTNKVNSQSEHGNVPGNNLKRFYFCLTAGLISVSAIAVFMQGDRSDAGVVSNNSTLVRNNYGSQIEKSKNWTLEDKFDCKNAIDWSGAKKYIDNTVVLVGPLLETKYKPNINGGPTFLSIGAKYPNKDRLQIVIWGKNRGNFSFRYLNDGWVNEDNAIAADKNIDHTAPPVACVSGKVTMYKNVPQIELFSENQIRVYTYSDRKDF